MQQRIERKQTMHDLMMRGQFGNGFEVWPLEEGLFHQKIPGAVYSLKFGLGFHAHWAYDLQPDELWPTRRRNRHLCRLEDVTVWEYTAVDAVRLIQGEVQRSEYGLDLHYSHMDAKMRTALSEAPLDAHGLRAKMLLEHYCDPASYDDLVDLLDRFDGAVVEFTVYDRDVGRLPHRNTIIWEVRHY